MEIVSKTVRMPITLISRLTPVAKKLGYSLNALILQILWEWVNDKKKM